MNDVIDCLARYRHVLLIASGGLLVLALLLWRAKKHGYTVHVAVFAVLLLAFGIMYRFKADATLWLPAAMTMLGALLTVIPSLKTNPKNEGIEQYEKRLRALEQLTLQQQAQATPGNEQEQLVNEAKLKAVQAKLADVEKSWADEQKLHRETKEDLAQLKGLLPDEQLKNAEERLAQGDKEAAEKAFDAVADKEGEVVARAAYRSGKLAENRLDYEKAMRQYKKAVLLQEETPDYLLDAGTMARTMGDYPQAQEWLEKLLKMREAEGKEDVELAIALNNLAVLYIDHGRYEEAEPLYKRSLKIVEQKLGKDHPDVATSLNNMANLYLGQYRYKEAELLYTRALEIREQKLGKDHPDVAESLNNLAELYRTQGRYEEAEPLYKRSLKIVEQKLGKDHPHVAAPLNNLANLYQAQGRYAEAEPLYKRALAIYEQKLGKDHPHVASFLNNLAELYRAHGRYDKTEPLLQRALAIYEHKLGKDHPHVAASLNNLAGLYKSQGRYEEAEPLYQRAIAIMNEKFPNGHPNLDIFQKNYDNLKAQQAGK